MRSADNLQTAAAQALEYLAAQPDIESAEVFASADANLTVRLNYTSHIPSNGVEEPKSAQSSGLGLRVVFHPNPDAANRPRTGFGSEPNDLSLDGVRPAGSTSGRGRCWRRRRATCCSATSSPRPRSPTYSKD